ncbi:MAG: hypothetical protein ACPLXC_00070 [Candidatus Pacearchaeota archaeon]
MAKTIHKTIEMILEDGERYIAESKDDKYFVYPEEFLIILQEALNEGLGPGREFLKLNRMQEKGNYVHDIMYRGINFITATPKMIKVDYE